MATETPDPPRSAIRTEAAIQGTAPLLTEEPELLIHESHTIQGRTQWQIFWNRFKRHRVGLVAAGVLSLIGAFSFIYPMVSPYGFDELNPAVSEQPPGWPHIFGTAELGVDQFTQVAYGGRVSIIVGLAAAVVATLVGTALGALAGYAGGWSDGLISRLTDVFLAAPPLAVLIAMTAVVENLTVTLIVLVIAVLAWMPVTRLVRAEFLALKEREFVQAGRAMGASPFRMMWRHILPNAASVIIVQATLLVGLAIIIEATLAFLGIGLDPNTSTSWGSLLDNAQNNVLRNEWWLVLFPGLAIVITVLCVNFVGDALRDALDPYGQTHT